MFNLLDGCEYTKLNLSYCKFCIYTHPVKFKIYNMTLHYNIGFPIEAAIFLKHYGTYIWMYIFHIGRFITTSLYELQYTVYIQTPF